MMMLKIGELIIMVKNRLWISEKTTFENVKSDTRKLILTMHFECDSNLKYTYILLKCYRYVFFINIYISFKLN